MRHPKRQPAYCLSKKYDVFTSEDEENRIEEIDINIAPEIVLSETIIP